WPMTPRSVTLATVISIMASKVSPPTAANPLHRTNSQPGRRTGNAASLIILVSAMRSPLRRLLRLRRVQHRPRVIQNRLSVKPGIRGGFHPCLDDRLRGFAPFRDLFLGNHGDIATRIQRLLPLFFFGGIECRA